MVIIPDKLIFLETPRTASRTVATLMEEFIPKAKRTGCRHVALADVPCETGLPIWTFTRYPPEHLFSWWKYGMKQKAPWCYVEEKRRFSTFTEFCKIPFSPLAGFEAQLLNVYASVATHVWPLEQGVARFFSVIGHPDVPHRVIGQTSEGRSLNYADIMAVKQYFARDWSFYSESRLASSLRLLPKTGQKV